MKHSGWTQQYLSFVPDDANWENAIPARSLFLCGNYSPIKYASKVCCPVYLVYGSHDQGIPRDAVERMAEDIKDVTLEMYDGDHFDVYAGPVHERIVERDAHFFHQHLRAA